MRTGPSLDLVKVQTAGFSIVNIQLSGKDGYRPGAWARRYADWARELGMGVSSYWWCDKLMPGVSQGAEAVERMRSIAADALQIDSESDATESIWRACVGTAQELLGRHVAAYSGDWWWMPRGWHGADLTPYLWAMPNVGPPNVYPGDVSPMWTAGYGGWDELSLLQYGVVPVGGVPATLTGIRNPNVWAALSGGPMAWYLNPALTRYRNAVNARYPNRDKTSDGTIGDEAHAETTSDHNPDTSAPNVGSVDAWDMDVDLRSGNDAAEIEALKQVFQTHPSARYWIHKGQIASRDIDNWRRRTYTGTNKHDKHVHWNTRESFENSTVAWVLREVEDMATPIEIWTHDLQNGEGERPAYTVLLAAEAYARAADDRTKLILAGQVTDAEMAGVETRLNARLIAATEAGEAAKAQLLTAVSNVDEEIAAKWGDPAVPDETVAESLRNLLGAERAARIAALLAT